MRQFAGSIGALSASGGNLALSGGYEGGSECVFDGEYWQCVEGEEVCYYDQNEAGERGMLLFCGPPPTLDPINADASCDPNKEYDPFYDECVCTNGSSEPDCWVEPVWPEDPPDPPGDGETPCTSCEPGNPPPSPPPYCGGATMDDRDLIRAEYDSTALFSGQPFKPSCEDLVSDIDSPAGYFSWDELSAALDHSVGVFADAMLSGIDAIRADWVATTSYAGLGGNSFYRCPRRNKTAGSTSLQSRHMYGDAADLKNPAYPSAAQDSIWGLLFLTAHVSGATVLTGSQDPKCSVACVHVDWR
ncbi:MAG TPA: hypothetical protein VMN60_01020 [Longimicrobiales bacterium]|nr:hypothetical protein [Longimicrobiales bacterium]